MDVTCVFCSNGWKWGADNVSPGRLLAGPWKPWICCDGCKYDMLEAALIMISGNVLLTVMEDDGN